MQLFAAVVLAVIALVIVINWVLISTRPETISVVNALVGQGVLVIFVLVSSRILLRKGLAGLRSITEKANSTLP